MALEVEGVVDGGISLGSDFAARSSVQNAVSLISRKISLITRFNSEALALAMGITFYVVRDREGRLSSVQMPPEDCEVVATIDPPISPHGRMAATHHV